MSSSSEHPVQEPARGRGLALLIEAFAEHPVAAAVLVLDAVIVARALLAPSPSKGEGRRSGSVQWLIVQGDPHPALAFGHRHPPPCWGRPSGHANARHHSGAMRSGPSALTTRAVTCRQVKRAGGPSGISASTVKGSGLASRSGGRGGFGGAGLHPRRQTCRSAPRRPVPRHSARFAPIRGCGSRAGRGGARRARLSD